MKVFEIFSMTDSMYMYNQMSNERHGSFRPSPNGVAKPTNTKAAHTQSYQRVPLRPTKNQRQLISVKSEGFAIVRKKQSVGELRGPRQNLLKTNTNENREIEMDYSSDDNDDEFGGEDEHIVRIDSPSTLSFPRPL